MIYDIFISYKRKSLATANNLYYRLTTRGYSTFFDLEEMRRDNFNVQLLNYIENAKDVFVLLEEGSLDACKQGNWEDDWFCKEIAHALKTKRNIIPILIGDYKMPKQEFFPEELKELSLKHALEFSFSYFEEYLNKLIEKGYITAEAEIKNKTTSIFKFYSNENCQVFKEGKLVCSLEGMSDEPYYLPVPRKGDYRFKVVSLETKQSIILKEFIEEKEDKEIVIQLEPKKKRFENIIVGMFAVLIALILFFSLFGTLGFCAGYFSNVTDVEVAMKEAFRQQRVTIVDSCTIQYSGETINFTYDVASGYLNMKKIQFELYDQITFERILMSISIPIAFERLSTYSHSIGNAKAKVAVLVGGTIGILCGYSIGEYIGKGWAIKENEEAIEEYFKKSSTKEMFKEKMR